MIDSHYLLACERALERLGYTAIDDGRCRSLSDSDGAKVATLPPAERYAVWLLDSMLVGLRAAAKGDATLALRSWQVCDYCGRTGGWPGPAIGDAFLTLRNWLEDTVRPTRAS